MADVFDVAQYILARQGEMTAMKLQKLVYYAQAWHLAWTEQPLFANAIEAWKDGPVCPDLYKAHAKMFRVSRLRSGDPSNLSDDQKDSIDRVLAYYGDKAPQWLSDLTHLEDPWKLARVGLPDGAAAKVEITHKAMLDYYANL
jgi:uncharacterized phage-associated protein